MISFSTELGLSPYAGALDDTLCLIILDISPSLMMLDLQNWVCLPMLVPLLVLWLSLTRPYLRSQGDEQDDNMIRGSVVLVVLDHLPA